MANKKISALTSATTPLAGTETLPIVQGGATVNATVANITGSGLYPGYFTTLTSTGNTTLGDAVTDTVIALGPVGIGTNSPQGKLSVSNSGADGLEVSPGLAVAGVVRLLAFNRSTVAYMPMRYQASEHQFYNASGQVLNISTAGNVGIGATANASAILDAQSTTKGVRMPNMTTVQKNAIATPAAGLMVFDTTLAKLCVYSGAAWQTITSI